MSRLRSDRSGFTVLEVIVVLGVVAALAGILVPLGFQILENRREDVAREQLLRIRSAILGSDPSRVGGRRQGGSPGGELPGTFGFAGDMGALPDTLVDLVVRPDDLDPFSLDDGFELGAGWRGPYLSTGSDDEPAEAFRDPFGRPIRWAVKDTTVDGVDWVGFLRSGGPDRERGTADDLTVPLPADEVRGSATGFLRHGSGQPVSGAPLSYAFREDGAVNSVVLSTDDQGQWEGPEHVFGPTVVRTGSPSGGHLGRVAGLDRVFGSSFEDVSFRTVNVTDDDVVIGSYTVTWDPGATPGCYTDGRFGGVDVSGGTANRKCSGETLSFTVPVRVPAGAAFGASVTERRFELDRPTVVTPDLVVAGEAGRRGRGEALVELLDWEDANGNPVDVRGLELTVTFSDGSATTFTVPGQ